MLLATLAGMRLAYWQVAAHDQLVDIAQQQLGYPIEEQATRGSIYDRTGVLPGHDCVPRFARRVPQQYPYRRARRHGGAAGQPLAA